MAGDSESSRVALVPSAGTGAWAARSPFPSEDFWAGDFPEGPCHLWYGTWNLSFLRGKATRVSL